MRLSAINTEPKRLPGPELLHDLVSRSSSNGEPAIDSLAKDGSRITLSYSEFHAASDSLAATIRSYLPSPSAVEEDQIVPVLLPQSPDLYVAQLAILKAGAAFCPLNLDAPPERVRFILADVGATVLITTKDLKSKLPVDLASISVLVLDELKPRDGSQITAKGSVAIPPPGAERSSIDTPISSNASKLAYVMYTSGSTGTPKGVGVSHAAATQSLLAHDRHIPSFRRLLQFAAPTFDVSVFEIFFPFFRGTTLVCCDRDDMLDDLPGVLRKLEVDACELTPTVAGSLLRKRENAPGLKLLLTIGEMLSERVIKEFGGTKDTPSMLWAMYGPTEAAIHCTLVPAMAADASTNQIGVPLDTVSCFVISTELNLDDPSSCVQVTAGEVGELVVGGYQNAVGYLNRPEQTAEAFIDSPFGPVYRTGDLARVLEDGTMECLGRMSEGQVKLRGQRIELGEVEHAVLRTPGCHSAIAAVVGSILVVFCEMESRDNDTLHQEAIAQKCAEWLPAFMVPGDIIVMDQFPRLSSGKVDRKGMKAGYEKMILPDDGTSLEGEEHALYSLVSKSVSDILGVEVGARTPLAHAGLDSLAAIRLASLLRNKDVQVSTIQVLKAKTTHDLCLVISEEGPETHHLDTQREPVFESVGSVTEGSDLLQKHRGDIVSVIPCTPLQSSMLFETTRDPSAYCNVIELTFSSAYDASHIVATLQSLAISNEILRTGFVHHEGQFRQVIFRTLRSSQISVVSTFDDTFQLSDDSSLLSPLRLQLIDTESPRALLHVHHSIYDGWSMDMILADWAALLRGEHVHPRPQFSRVVSFYQTIDERDLEESRRFWTEHLLGWEKTPLPKLCGREDLPGNIAATRSFDLATNKQDLMSFSREFGCSPQVIFQAALLWIWSAILGTEDVVLGSVTSGRTIAVADIERILGPCIASMPLRANLSSVATIADLINLVQSNNRAIIEHAILPLSEIRKLTTSTGSQSIYDVLFVYQESLVNTDRSPTDIVEISHLDALETPILLEVEPRVDSFHCRVTYHSQVIEPSFVDVLLRQFGRVVDSILKAPTEPLHSIRDGFPVELQSIYNLEVKQYTTNDNLVAVVEAATRRFSAKPAVHFARSITDDNGTEESTTLSFNELNILANKIARYIIQELGPQKPQGVIAIIMEKSALLYASILGILKSGHAYLPILPSTPIARIQAIIEQSGAVACMTDSVSYHGLCQARLGTVLNVETADLGRFQETNLDVPVTADLPAYVIYTSGTTGHPKGVVITNRNIVSHLDILEQIYPVDEDSRLLQSCSQAFDVSVFEIFFAWKTGMCVCSATNDVLFEDLERGIRALDITHLSMTPTVASIVSRKAVPRVRFLVTAGEPMTQAVFEEWKGSLYQGYGPSETTNICTVKKMAAGDHIEHLGFAFDNTSAFVVYPDNLTLAPIGCVGELCFGGDQVAQGYLNEPELTATKFTTHPTFGPLYRSGDLGRMLPDGSMLIMGRLDGQVKLRGQRIDVGEIASIITRTGHASSSVVLTVSRGKEAPKQLAVFYTKPASSRPDFHVEELGDEELEINSSLFAALESFLPSYMVPSYLIPVSCIPMTPSGKIERKLLIRAYDELDREYIEGSSRSAGDAGNALVALSSEEGLVAETISAALNVDANLIGRWTPLASVGLDSINAISVAKRLSERLGRKVTISAILQQPFVAQLAATLFEASSQEVLVNRTREAGYLINDTVTSALQTRFGHAGLSIESILPCTPLQEAMLAAKEDGTYYNHMVLRLKASPTLLKSSWEVMSKRHGILRTCFMSTDDPRHPFVQVVLEQAELPWHPSHPGSTTASSLHNLGDIVGMPVDSMTPPFALEVVFEGEIPYLCFLCHHAMYDGVAISVLLSEVEQELRGGGSLPPPVSYESFLHEALARPESTDNFWTAQFRDFRPVKFSRPETSGSSVTSASLTMRLDLPLDDLEARTHSLGMSLSSVSQAAWANLLSIATGAEDVCFGNVMNGRSVPVEDVDRLVAPCFNTVPLRVNFSEHAQGTGLLRHLHRLSPMVMEHQFTPLRHVQKLVGQPRGLFDTLLLLQPPETDLDPDVWELISDVGGMDVPLVCEIRPNLVVNTIDVNLYYDETCFPKQFVAAVGDAVNHLMSFLVKFPSSALRQLQDFPEHIQRDIRLVAVTDSAPTELSSTSSNTGTWSDVELKIRGVLSRLSSVPLKVIGKNTTIFQLGLDSINAVQAAGLLRKEGLSVTATDILTYPTCEGLGRRFLDEPAKSDVEEGGFDVLEFQKRVDPLVRPGLPQDGVVEAILPCTPVQIAMVTEFVQSKGRDYFNYVHLKIDEGISLSGVLEAWRGVFLAHAMLRVGFVCMDSPEYRNMSYGMVKYRPQACKMPLSVVEDVQRLSIHKWRLDMAQEVMASMHEPLWRTILVQDGDRVSVHLAIHHALYDAQSLRQILDDLARCISGEKALEPTSLEKTSSSIMGLVENGDDEDAQAFWSSFANDAVLNNFPVMTPLRVEHGDMLSRSHVSALTFDELLKATRSANVSIQAALQAAWTRVLSSYQGEDSVIFGTVMAGRVTESLQNAAFPCITTVPVIATNTNSNEDLLRAMMDVNRGLHRHQFSRLGDIQRWIGHPGRRLFDSLLVYQRLPETEAVRLPWEVMEDEGIVDYPVSIEVEPQRSGAVKFRMTFQSHIIPQEQASLMMAQLDAALRHLVLEPQGSEHDLWKSVPELAARIPPPVPELPSQVSLLHQFVELQASRQPDKVALEFVEAFRGQVPVSRSWTFSELNAVGNGVAATLSSRVEAGSIVAIHFDKCPEAYFSILGILKAGCSFLAIDPAAPRARKEFILSDSGAAAVLAKDAHDLDFTSPVPVIAIDEKSIPRVAHRVVVPEISPQSTCYCLYTSGTTGAPKGCEITHENAVQAMMAFQELFKGHWDEESRCLQFAALHFDVSVLEQYWSWSVGMRVVSAPRDLILDDLEGSIDRLGITHIDLTPSLASLVRPEKVPSLWKGKGVFITGGEQLKQEILDVWGPKGVIYNAYGPTEATIGVTMRQRVPITGRSVNIGQQFPNVGTYVFRQDTETLVPRGGVGELCVSGMLVGKGYLARPELTAKKFPVLQSWGGERVYRTGDLVRLLHDGSFDFLGRADDQVKLRGQRLQLGEIDHAIRSGVSEIRDVTTLVAQHGKTGKDLLVSFVVPSTLETRDSGRLEMLDMAEAQGLCGKAREACKAKVPGYMVPTYVVPVPFIPLSRNNKAEVKELRSFFNTLSTEDLSKLSTPTARNNTVLTETGRSVMRLLSEFTGDESGAIDGEMNIFELGLDSISIPRFSRLLRQKKIPGSPEVIMMNPVINDLIKALQDVPRRSAQSNITDAKQTMRAHGHRFRGLVCRELGVPHEEIEYIVPCTPIQEGMISRALAGGQENTAYFNTFSFSLRQGVSVERLRHAWEQTIDEHAVLRSRFVATPDGFVQVALRRPGSQWMETTFTTVEFQTGEGRLRDAWVDRNSVHVVSPLEFVVNRDGEHVRLVAHVFHGLYDGNSFDTLLRHVSCVYRGETPPVGPLFVDVLPLGPLWRYGSSKEFWAGHLRGWRPTELSEKLTKVVGHAANGDLADAPAIPPTESTRDVLINHTIQIGDLERVRRTLGVTLQSVVLGLWVSTLQKYVAGDLTTGIIVSGRSLEVEGIEDCIGPLFNTVPFFVQPSQEDTWRSLIRKCHDFAASVSSFQHVSLRDIQKWCSGGTALFDNLFAFQVEEDGEVAGDSLWVVEEEEPTADYPLAFEGTVKGDVLAVSILASGKVMGEGQVEELMRKFCSSVGELIENQEAHIGTDTKSDPVPQPRVANGDGGDGDVARIPLSMSSDLSDDARLFLREISAICGLDTSEIFQDQGLVNLGLDSIDTVRLAARLRTEGLALTASEIARCSNIGEMVSQLGNRTFSSPESVDGSGYERLKADLKESIRDAGLSEEDVEDVLPPTPLQETMVSQMLQTECRRYFNHDLLEVGSHVDLDKLAEAWITVWRRSPILRTVFVEVEDPAMHLSMCQVVLRPRQLEIVRKTLDDLGQVGDVIEETREEAARAMARGKLLQLHLLAVGDKNYVLLSISHALYDGWSLALLHQDVEAAYRDQVVDRPNADGYLRRIHSTPSESGEFWSQYLVDARPTLVSDVSDEHETLLHRAEAISNINGQTVAAFGKTHGVSMQVLGQACWAAVLGSMKASLDLTFGVVLSGRDFEGAEDVMFPTMNTVAVRYVLHGTVAQFLKYMEESMAGIREHQSYPLRKALRRGAGLFNTLFLFQKAPFGEVSGEEVMTSVESAAAVEYPVCVELEVVGDELVWRTACQGSYFDAKSAELLLYRLDRVLAYLVQSPDKEVLSFEHPRVSICGLEFVELEESEMYHEEIVPVKEAAGEEWSETEAAIRDVVSQISGASASEIRKSATIYSVGLDSISAIKVAANLRRLGIHIPVRELLAAESIGHMAMAVSKATEPTPALPALEDRNLDVREMEKVCLAAGIDTSANEVEDVLPALPMQVYVLSTWQNSRGSVFYPTFKYRLLGDVSKDGLQAAWSSLVGETPLLRTCFAVGDEWPLVQIVLRGGAIVGRRARVLWDDEHMDGHDLVRVRARREGRGWLLDISIHHALYDAVSLAAILGRFVKLCGGGVSEQELSGTAWREFTRMHVAQEVVHARRMFWTEYLSGLDAESGITQLPSAEKTSRPAKSVPDVSRAGALYAKAGVSIWALFIAVYETVIGRRSPGERREDILAMLPSVGLDTEPGTTEWPSTDRTSHFVKGVLDISKARAWCAKAGVSLQALFFAAYATVIGRRSSKESVVLGVYLANRADATVSDTHLTLNLVPLRVALRGDIGAVAAEVQRDIHAITGGNNASVGLWEVEAWTGVRLDSFVNFIVHDGGDLPGHGVKLEEVDGVEEEEAASEEFGAPEWLRGNQAARCFPPAVDVEASVTDGGLNIGVFAPRLLMDDGGAGEMVVEIRGLLDGVE